MTEYGLGRLVAIDPRDGNYLLASPRVAPTRMWRNWYDGGWWGDQGQEPQCVGFAWSHFLEAAPTTHPKAGPSVDPTVIYTEAQRLDEWPGEGYAGTSVRAGAKFLQSIGAIGEYLWAFDADTVCRNLLETGPVVLGINWYDSMFAPDARGVIHVDGGPAGGHAILATGYHRTRKRVRLKNSWGRGWGTGGHAWLGVDDLERLIREDGEACLAVEP